MKYLYYTYLSLFALSCGENQMNSKSIGDSIDFFYKNPNKTIAMGDAAANYAKEKLSYDLMTKNITDFFDNINKK